MLVPILVFIQIFFLKTIGNTGKIYSIELHPQTANILTNRFNNYDNVFVFNNAICDKNEMIDYYAGVDSFTNNIIGHDMNYKKNVKIGEISGTTLDNLLRNENHIRLIKIDVEGSELSVLKGMKKTIKKTDYVLLECHLDEH
jgi:FkbM family methyltransferase